LSGTLPSKQRLSLVARRSCGGWPMPSLRPYQEDLITRARETYVDGAKAPLVVAPTGAGKTVIFAEIVKRCMLKGTRVLILAHRRELIRQASEKLTAAGVLHGIIEPGAEFSGHAVQVGSVQTVARRLGKPEAQGYGLIILDEAHHAVAGQWSAILADNPSAKVLGVTATPERLDGRGLGADVGGFFDNLVLGPTIAELQSEGFLCAARVFAPAGGGPDVSRVKRVAGDYAKGELEAVMGQRTVTGDAVSHYRQHADGVPALAFCVSVAHAETVAGVFREAGYRAVAVSGATTPAERDAAIKGLSDGSVPVLATCDLISEGLDVPGVGCVILLRPTNSLCLHVQQVGRGLRPAEGKAALIILDHAGNSMRHGLPDEPREWTLNGKRKRNSTAPALRQCSECYAIFRPKPACPECGHVHVPKPSAGRNLKQVGGELEEVGRGPTKSEIRIAEREAKWRSMRIADAIKDAKDMRELRAIAKIKGFKTGWAWHAMQQKKSGLGILT